jgi:hypothetical protein
MTFEDNEQLQSILRQQAFPVEVRNKKGEELIAAYPAEHALTLVAGGSYVGFGNKKRIRCIRPTGHAIEYLEPMSEPGRLERRGCIPHQRVALTYSELMRVQAEAALEKGKQVDQWTFHLESPVRFEPVRAQQPEDVHPQHRGIYVSPERRRGVGLIRRNKKHRYPIV